MPTKKKPARASGGKKLIAGGRKPVLLGFPPAEHKRLRVAAARGGVSMAAFARAAILRAVEAAEQSREA